TVNPYVTGSSPVRGAIFVFSCRFANLALMQIQRVSVKSLSDASSLSRSASDKNGGQTSPIFIALMAWPPSLRSSLNTQP
ncbi:hypothetical protein, partial [Pantoea vagans]|uniref:hypothetical protein n=1 Tax=Pantoea vagans TaxID=470934 RepID=UPI0019554239